MMRVVMQDYKKNFVGKNRSDWVVIAKHNANEQEVGVD